MHRHTSQVPYIVYNVPALDEAVAEWSDPVKLSDALGGSYFRYGSSFFGRLIYVWFQGFGILFRPTTSVFWVLFVLTK